MQALFAKYFQEVKKAKKAPKRAEKRWKFATICDLKCTWSYWFSTKTQYLQFKQDIIHACNISHRRGHVYDKPSLAFTKERYFYAVRLPSWKSQTIVAPSMSNSGSFVIHILKCLLFKLAATKYFKLLPGQPMIGVFLLLASFLLSWSNGFLGLYSGTEQ